MSAIEEKPTDDYDGLYSVAQALSTRFMELYAENKKLKVKPEPTEFTKERREYIEDYYKDSGGCVLVERQGKMYNTWFESFDIIEQLQARSIDCPNRPASKTEVEMAKRLCEYQDEVYKLKQQIKELKVQIDKLVEGQQAKIRAGS